jgi:hypothetical protein
MLSLSNITIPAEFSSTKAYVTGALRAENSARDFNNHYYVTRSNSYQKVGPPMKCCGDRKRVPHLEQSRLFLTTYKDHSDAGRVANAH